MIADIEEFELSNFWMSEETFAHLFGQFAQDGGGYIGGHNHVHDRSF